MIEGEVKTRMETHMATEEESLGHYWRLPYHIRVVGLFLLGLAPMSCLLVIGTGAVPNLAVLEATTADTLISIIVVALLVSLSAKSRSLHIATYAAGLLLTGWWIIALHVRYWNLYSNTVSISVLMGFLMCGYLVRVHLVYQSRRTTIEYLHTQFKTDSVLVVLAVLYYGFSFIFQSHFAGVARQIAVIAVSCIVLWAFILWQVEQSSLGREKSPLTSYLGLFFSVLAAAAIELPASFLTNAVNVKTKPYDPTAPPELHPSKNAHSHPHPHASRHYLLTASTGRYIALALLVVAILVVVVFLVRSRKKQTAVAEAAELGSGVMSIVKRNRLGQHRGLAFLSTGQPVRRQVQSWLRGLSKKGGSVDDWETIRAIASRHPQEDIQSLLATYEQVRYDPDSATPNES